MWPFGPKFSEVTRRYELLLSKYGSFVNLVKSRPGEALKHELKKLFMDAKAILRDRKHLSDQDAEKMIRIAKESKLALERG